MDDVFACEMDGCSGVPHIVQIRNLAMRTSIMILVAI
jgi:hypothetical protein